MRRGCDREIGEWAEQIIICVCVCVFFFFWFN